ncbi:MAG: alanine racemase [Actinobacteria bacterium]|nr:alanine racemase [Actinomycetota bacterium]MBU1493299.1 alanine racemase [Actinomycetota bacterium]MBU1866832.1 alanine racemase [Actinomycetota bacterium]
MRPTWIEIDLGAIRDNVAAIAAAVAPARVCAVVKADGYGHGDVPTAEAAREGGAQWLAVALVAEGARLREAGVDGPILLLSEPFPEEVSEIVRWELTPTVYRESFVDALAEVAPAGYPAHLKVDTGMHRVGASPEEAGRLATLIERKGLVLEGVWTHFAVSEEDPMYTAEQTQRLMGFLGGLAARGVVPPILHASNTGGALGDPSARLDMVRVGIGIYGLRPAPGFHPEVPLRPAMRVVSHVSFLQRLPAGARPSYGRVRPLAAESTVATVPIGYADGVPRRLREAGGMVLIRGKRRPFAGTVTMDQIVVDMGDDPVEVGDEVVLLGAQGGEEITAGEWADLLGTIVYEIVCGFGPRIPRRYHG